MNGVLTYHTLDKLGLNSFLATLNEGVKLIQHQFTLCVTFPSMVLSNLIINLIWNFDQLYFGDTHLWKCSFPLLSLRQLRVHIWRHYLWASYEAFEYPIEVCHIPWRCLSLIHPFKIRAKLITFGTSSSIFIPKKHKETSKSGYSSEHIPKHSTLINVFNQNVLCQLKRPRNSHNNPTPFDRAAMCSSYSLRRHTHDQGPDNI